MKSACLLAIGCLWSLFAAGSLATSETGGSLVLAPGDGVRTVARPAILLDQDAVLDVAAMAGKSPAFQTQTTNLGYQSGAVWLRLPIRNHSDRTHWWLEVGEPRLQRLTLYVPDGDDDWRQLHGGMGTPQASKALPERRNLFPLELPPGEETLVYLKVVSPTAISVPVSLWQPAAFLRDEGAAMLYIGLLLGVIGCVGLYFLLVFGLLRESVYGWFTLAMGAGVVYVSAYEGLLHRFFSGGWVEWSLRTVVITSALFLYAMLGYSRRFLALSTYAHRVNQLGGVLQWLLLALFAFSLVGPYAVAGPLATLSVLLVGVFLVVAGAMAWWRGYHPARLYCLTMGLLWGVLVFSQFEILGLIPVNIGAIGRNAALLLVMPLLAAAFVDRQFLLQRQRDLAQQQTLTVQQEMVSTLESRVWERTRQARQAQAEAEQASQAKNDFLATVTHELRTPLTTVLGVADLLEDMDLDADKSRLVGVQRRASDQLLSLIDAILDLARLEHGDVELVDRVFASGKLVEDVVTMLQPQAEARGLVLRVEGTPGMSWVRGDADRLRQVVTNLVANGIKYTEQGGVIVRAKTREAGQGVQLRLSVEDTGRGIESAQLGAIFQPFFTVDNHREGTGLGLAISQRIVRQMGGWISVESEPGLGSCFTLELPFPVADAPAPLPQRLDSLLALDILLVEDQPENRQIISQLIAADGHRVSVCGDGHSALEATAATEFDLVLMDRRLPDGDGVDFARAMIARLGARRPHTRLIMLTANVTRDTLQRCREAGLDGVLSKPIRRDRLRQVVAGQGVAVWDDKADVVAMEPLAPELRAELEQRHRQTLEEVLVVVESGVSAGEWTPVARGAHRLAGSAALLGQHALATLAREAELAAEAGDGEPVRRLMIELQALLG